MSVTNTPRKAGPYTGNNVAVQFTFAFKVFADTDLVVTRAVIATGAEIPLTLTTDYTVTRNGDQDTSPGGYVTLVTPLASTYTLTLTSAVPDVQPQTFTNLGGFFPSVLNTALDRLTILVQQLKEIVSRSLKLAVSTPTGFDATLPAPVAYGVLGFNGTADGFAVTDPSGSSALAGDLANKVDAGKGAGLVGFKLNYVSSLGRLLSLKVSDWESIADFYPDGAPSDDQTAWANAWSALTTGKRTLYMPVKTGGYTYTAMLTVPSQCGLICAPGVILNFTGTTNGIRFRNGVTATGNGCRLRFSNPAWDAYGLYLDGADRFANDYPTFIDGFFVEGNTTTKGVAAGLVATNATNFISFVTMTNIGGTILRKLLDVNCGSSGSAGDVATWHWINGNTFENWTAYGTDVGVTLLGTTSVPAEVNGNQFRNFQFQTPGRLWDINGACANNIDFYAFDWTYGSSAVVFSGGAANNQVRSNITVSNITDASNANQCTDYAGGMTKSRSITGNVTVSGYGAFGTTLECTSHLRVHDTSLVKIGYASLEGSIYGADEMRLTPRSGYAIRLASAASVDGIFNPGADNSFTLGTSAKRWSVVYAGTGTINTSDERAKQDIAPIDAAVLRAWAKVQFCQFRFKDAVEQKADGARIHFGVIAQRVKEAFESEDLDPFAYGVLCFDQWADEFTDEETAEEYTDEDGEARTRPVKTGNKIQTQWAGERYGVRYEEALALECAYLRSRVINT